MRISDWSSDVCSSDLEALRIDRVLDEFRKHAHRKQPALCEIPFGRGVERVGDIGFEVRIAERHRPVKRPVVILFITDLAARGQVRIVGRSEEHTSELQSLMRISYAVFCLKKKNNPSIIYQRRKL